MNSISFDSGSRLSRAHLQCRCTLTEKLRLRVEGYYSADEDACGRTVTNIGPISKRRS